MSSTYAIKRTEYPSLINASHAKRKSTELGHKKASVLLAWMGGDSEPYWSNLCPSDDDIRCKSWKADAGIISLWFWQRVYKVHLL